MADGFVILDFDGWDDHVRTLRVSADRIHAQVNQDLGYSYQQIFAAGMFGTDSDGNLVAGFGQGGRLSGSTTYTARDELLNANDSFLLLRPDIGVVESRDAVGGLLVDSPPMWSMLPPATYGDATVFARQADGKILVGGTYRTTVQGEDSLNWALTRLTSDLTSIDTTFGGGAVIQNFSRTGGFTPASVDAITALPGGQILVSGRVQTSRLFSDVWQTVIERFNANGSVDGTFGTNAQLFLPDSTGITRVDSTGRIYLASPDGRVTRLSSTGTADAGYAGGAANPSLHFTGFELDSQGRALIFGWTTVNNVRLGYVSRLDANGSPDVAFNGTGSATVTFPMVLAPADVNGRYPLCVGAIQSSDKPLIACDVKPAGDADDAPANDLAIARLTTAGAIDTTFGAAQIDSDVFPDDYSFTPVTVPYGTALVQSGPATVSGINAPIHLTASAKISVGCNGNWQSGPVVVRAGDTFCVRGDAPASANTTGGVTVDLGGRVSRFVVQTTGVAADTIPDPFTFASQTSVAPGVDVVSAPITVQGITGYASVSVVNGYFSVNCNGSYQSSSPAITVPNGTTICVQHTSSLTDGGSVTTTLSIGGVLGTFTSTTVMDSAPDAFTFTTLTNVARSTAQLSNNITVTGINVPTTISITGGEYSIGCNSFTSAAGTVTNGQFVCVRHTASASASTAVTSTLTIGGVSGAFTSTTAAASGGGSSSSSSGGGGGGGSMDPALLAFALGLLAWTLPRRTRQKEMRMNSCAPE